MDENIPLYKLQSLRVNSIIFRPTSSEKEPQDEDKTFSSSIESSFADDLETYEKERIISVKLNLNGKFINYFYELEIESKVEVLDKNVEYSEIVSEEPVLLFVPILDKASLLLGNLYESATGFPTLLDLTSMYSEQRNKES